VIRRVFGLIRAKECRYLLDEIGETTNQATAEIKDF